MKRFIFILVLLLALMIPAGVVLAAPHTDKVESGETVNNDVIIFDDDLEIEEGAVVNGNVTVFSGDVYVAGEVNGDIVLFDGDLEATETAVFGGDCVLWSGKVVAGPESLSCTQVSHGADFSELADALPPLADIPGVAAGPTDVPHRAPSFAARFFGALVEGTAGGLFLGFLAFLMASFLPQHLNMAEETLRRKPIVSGTVGLLTAIAVPSVAVLLVPVSVILLFVCIGLLGFPIIFVLMVGWAAGMLFGWITVGTIAGEWLARPLNLAHRGLPLKAALGTALLTFAVSLLGAIPYVFGEGLVTILLIFIGLGATALTQFGTKPYPRVNVAIAENPGKVSAVLDTLPDDDPAQLKDVE